MKYLIAALCVLTVMGCVWVKPTPQSHDIALLSEDDVVNCVKTGVTSVKTLNKILFIPRSQDKIYGELVALARNEAVILEGDSIVPNGEVKKAALDFSVYRCR